MNGVPTFATLFKTIIPSCSSEIPNSFSEQIIPRLSSPLIFALVIVIAPGSTAPTGAKAIFCPVFTLKAPQTICKVSFPS